MLGVLDPTEIEHLLRTQRIARLGVHDGDHVYVFPICYGYDGTDVYLHTGDGLKLRLLRAHPEVCLEVEDIISPAQWRTVMLHGAAEELSGERERDAALTLIAGQGEPHGPLSMAPYAGGADKVAVCRIRVSAVTGRFERDEVIQKR